MRNKEILPFVITWVDLEVVKQNKSYLERQVVHDTFICVIQKISTQKKKNNGV